MEERFVTDGARYQQIAADIASKIVDRQYQIGEKIYTRSLIASQYSVSSETARRAIAILSALDIVETVKGSGVVIKSYDNALQYVKRFHDVRTLSELKRDTLKRLDLLAQENSELRESVTKLVDHADQFRSSNPFIPFEITVEAGAVCVGQCLAGLNFWQHTSATVVAIRRSGVLILSPGASTSLETGDVIYFVGDEGCIERVGQLLR